MESKMQNSGTSYPPDDNIDSNTVYYNPTDIRFTEESILTGNMNANIMDNSYRGFNMNFGNNINNSSSSATSTTSPNNNPNNNSNNNKKNKTSKNNLKSSGNVSSTRKNSLPSNGTSSSSISSSHNSFLSAPIFQQYKPKVAEGSTHNNQAQTHHQHHQMQQNNLGLSSSDSAIPTAASSYYSDTSRLYQSPETASYHQPKYWIPNTSHINRPSCFDPHVNNNLYSYSEKQNIQPIETSEDFSVSFWSINGELLSFNETFRYVNGSESFTVGKQTINISNRQTVDFSVPDLCAGLIF